MAYPPAWCRAVDTRDDGDVERALGPFDELEGAIDDGGPAEVWEIGERLGERFRALGVQGVQLEPARDHLFLEERRQDDRRCARVLQHLERVEP
jgi:hypothetical protein